MTSENSVDGENPFFFRHRRSSITDRGTDFSNQRRCNDRISWLDEPPARRRTLIGRLGARSQRAKCRFDGKRSIVPKILAIVDGWFAVEKKNSVKLGKLVAFVQSSKTFPNRPRRKKYYPKINGKDNNKKWFFFLGNISGKLYREETR